MASAKQLKQKKTEHSPCPMPERAIFGFVVYLLTYVMFGFYLLWALLPDEWLHQIGINYLPQRLWIFLGPFLFVFAVVLAVLAFLIYNWTLIPDLDSLNNFTDKHQKLHPEALAKGSSSNDTLLPLGDIHITYVNQRLYLSKE